MPQANGRDELGAWPFARDAFGILEGDIAVVAIVNDQSRDLGRAIGMPNGQALPTESRSVARPRRESSWCRRSPTPRRRRNEPKRVAGSAGAPRSATRASGHWRFFTTPRVFPRARAVAKPRSKRPRRPNVRRAAARAPRFRRPPKARRQSAEIEVRGAGESPCIGASRTTAVKPAAVSGSMNDIQFAPRPPQPWSK